MVAMGIASKRMGKTGATAMLLQNAAHAAGIRPFSSPGHPLLLHGIGMSVAASMAIAMVVSLGPLSGSL
jgi:hypothetical protein